MARSSTPSNEDGTHRLLLFALFVLATVVALRAPPPAGPPMGAVADSGPLEASRGEIQNAIARLEPWLERAYGTAGTPLEAALAAYGLGRDKANAAGRPLETCLSAWSPADSGGLTPALAAAVFLDAGLPRTERLRTRDGEIVLEELAGGALRRAGETRVFEGADAAWLLQLLALASASGIEGQRDELARRTEGALTKLEYAYRALELGTPSPEREHVTEFAAATSGGDALGARALELQLSSAVFFANAVSPHPNLEGRVRRHLQSLLARYDLDRASVRRVLTEAARDPRALHAQRLAALELYGRLGQALFMAHLVARPGAEGMPPASATVMRQAAGETVRLLELLTKDGVFSEVRHANARERLALLSSVVQALRGLRTARSATTS
jgi:hypothetical protein